jgi:hypothetical protein
MHYSFTSFSRLTLLPFIQFCEFSGTQGKCKAWLQKNNAQEYARLYGQTEGAIPSPVPLRLLTLPCSN